MILIIFSSLSALAAKPAEAKEPEIDDEKLAQMVCSIDNREGCLMCSS